MRKAPTLRSVAIVATLVVIFGGGGALFFGALDKAQTSSTTSVFDLSALAGFVSHFFSQFVVVITTGQTPFGVPYRSLLLQGIATTLEFCFIAMPIALVLGLVLALMSRSKRAILRVPARGYVEFFRDTPLLVQMLAIYWALTFLGPTLVSPFTAGLATLVLNYAAYECENLRAGLVAVDRGQGEAADVLGLSQGQKLRLIEIPQVIPIVLPPVINDLIYMYKDSAILSLITVIELTAELKPLRRYAPNLSWQFYIWVGIAYLFLSLPLSRVARAIERRLKAVTFVPRFDVVTTTIVVLLSTAAVGWFCGLALVGLSAQTVGDHLSELFYGVALTIGVMVFTLLVFVLVLYLPRQLIGALRGLRGNPPGSTQAVAGMSS